MSRSHTVTLELISCLNDDKKAGVTPVKARSLALPISICGQCQQNASKQCSPCGLCGVYWSFFPATNIFCTWNTL